MSDNDEKIFALKKKIEEKREQLKATEEVFVPVTNCSLEINNTRYNIHALNKEQAVHLLVVLNMYLLSANNLELTNELKICGFEISDWIKDVKLKFRVLKIVEEKSNLKKMEARLQELLSDDKKAEIELDEISKLLL